MPFSRPRKKIWLAGAVIFAAVLLTLFSSSLPDGLESVAGHLGFSQAEQAAHDAPLAGYRVSGRLPQEANQIISAFAGMLVVAGAVFLLFKIQVYFKKSNSRTNR